MLNLNKNHHRHSEFISESNRHCERSEAISSRLPRPYGLAMTNESGRSMVEMLGVLAVIGVLSITGISGYTTAMNKHKANEILDNASKRAVAVAGQIQLGNTSPTLGEFGTNTIQGVTYGDPYKLGDNQFAIPLTWDNTLTDDLKTTLCKELKTLLSEDGTNSTAQVDTDCTRIVYNNDLSNGATSSNNTNYDSSTKKCKTGYYGDDCQNECTGDHKVVKNNACVCDEDNSYYADEEDSSQCVLDRCRQISCNEDQTCNPDDGQCVCNEAGQLSNGTSCVAVETSCPTESSSANTEGSSTGKYVAVDGVAILCRCNGTKAYDGTAGCVDVQSACPEGASTLYTATSTGKYINESGVAKLCGCDTDYTWTPTANSGAGECVEACPYDLDNGICCARNSSNEKTGKDVDGNWQEVCCTASWTGSVCCKIEEPFRSGFDTTGAENELCCPEYGIVLNQTCCKKYTDNTGIWKNGACCIPDKNGVKLYYYTSEQYTRMYSNCTDCCVAGQLKSATGDYCCYDIGSVATSGDYQGTFNNECCTAAGGTLKSYYCCDKKLNGETLGNQGTFSDCCLGTNYWSDNGICCTSEGLNAKTDSFDIDCCADGDYKKNNGCCTMQKQGYLDATETGGKCCTGYGKDGDGNYVKECCDYSSGNWDKDNQICCSKTETGLQLDGTEDSRCKIK